MTALCAMQRSSVFIWNTGRIPPLHAILLLAHSFLTPTDAGDMPLQTAGSMNVLWLAGRVA